MRVMRILWIFCFKVRGGVLGERAKRGGAFREETYRAIAHGLLGLLERHVCGYLG